MHVSEYASAIDWHPSTLLNPLTNASTLLHIGVKRVALYFSEVLQDLSWNILGTIKLDFVQGEGTEIPHFDNSRW